MSEHHRPSHGAGPEVAGRNETLLRRGRWVFWAFAAIAANPPHPHAALLMADFLLSPDGQAVLEKYYYGSGTKDYGFKKWRPEHGLTTDQYEKDLLRWDKLLHSITRK